MLVTKFSIDKSKRCTTAWLNLRTLLSMQFFTYKVMTENSGLTYAKDCDACSLWKDVPLHNFLTYMDVFAWKFSHRSTCLHTTCYTISYVVLDRHVSSQCVYYETCSCACSHTKRRLSVHFLTYKVMRMRNFKHITPCWSQAKSELLKKNLRPVRGRTPPPPLHPMLVLFREFTLSWGLYVVKKSYLDIKPKSNYRISVASSIANGPATLDETA